jgi:hypothetical protein
MIIYTDENISPHLGRALNHIQKGLNPNIQVIVLKDEFGQGLKDHEWIPLLKGQNAYVITQDVNIHRRKHERELYERYEIGVFFLKANSKKHGLSYWEQVQAIVKNWESINQIISKKKPPFAYIMKMRSKPEEI